MQFTELLRNKTPKIQQHDCHKKYFFFLRGSLPQSDHNQNLLFKFQFVNKITQNFTSQGTAGFVSMGSGNLRRKESSFAIHLGFLGSSCRNGDRVKHNLLFLDIHLNLTNHSQSASLTAIKGAHVISLDWASAVKKKVVHLTNWFLFC